MQTVRYALHNAALKRPGRGAQLGLSVLFFVFAMLGAGLAVFLGGVFSRLKLVGIVSASVVWGYLAVSLLVLSAFGTPVSYACIRKRKKEGKYGMRQKGYFCWGHLPVIRKIQWRHLRARRNLGQTGSNWMCSRAGTGSFFDNRFAGERVPLLSEVIAFAKENGINLNIEMKPAGHEHEFEQKVAEIIKTKKFVDQCVVTSQVYDVLERIKSCDSRIRTVYVMSIAYGDINALTAADHFSIEASNVTEKLVSDVM